MSSPRARRLAFELLEPKASPSAVLLALAPLEEPDQRMIESERAMYGTTTVPSATNDANAALLEFIERNTRSNAKLGTSIPLPTAAQTAAVDTMMQATDADLRSMLISETLVSNSADGEYACSVFQF